MGTGEVNVLSSLECCFECINFFPGKITKSAV